MARRKGGKSKGRAKVRGGASSRRAAVAKPRKRGIPVRRKARVRPRHRRAKEGIVEEGYEPIRQEDPFEEFELTATTKGWTPRRRD